jgi:hypothetical protein
MKYREKQSILSFLKNNNNIYYICYEKNKFFLIRLN